MGILNVTPDSFSDGGEFVDVDKAFAHAMEMIDSGAQIIDVGPESSRPGSKRISAQEQIKRAAPLIEKLSSQSKILISIDTYDSQVAKACLDSGAAMVNDITAGGDPKMFQLCADRDVPIVLMHMQKTPENMQEKPTYANVVLEVRDYLLERAALASRAGIRNENIILDPGIGFGKSFQDNIELMRNLSSFTNNGYRVLLGASRKRFLGELTAQDNSLSRGAATIATTLAALTGGVDIVRLHDVRENVDAMKVAVAISQAKK